MTLVASERESRDIVERLGADTARGPRDRAIVFVDIDDLTYRAWGRHAITPRDKLLGVLACVTSGNPAAVVVDIMLDADGTAHDQDLRSFLNAYGVEPWPDAERLAPKCRTSRQAAPASLPPLVLVLSTERALDGSDGDVRTAAECSENRSEDLRPHAYSRYVENPNVVFAASSYCLESDGVIRDWLLWDYVGAPSLDDAAQVPTIGPANDALVPSVALLTTALLSEGRAVSARAVRDKITACLYLPEVRRCSFGTGDRAFEINRRWREQRLLFTLSGGGRFLAPFVDLDGRRVRALETVSAEFAADAVPEPEYFRDRIVIVGTSHLEGGDVHDTPLGEMPGPLLLANTLRGFNAHGQLRSWSDRVIEGVAFVLLASVLLVLFSIAKYKVMVGFSLSAVLLVAAYALRRHGVHVDFLLPAFASWAVALLGEFYALLKVLLRRFARGRSLCRRIDGLFGLGVAQ